MIELPDARESLEGFHPIFIEGYQVAWANWRRFMSLEGNTDLAAPLSSTSRANFIHDHVCIEFEKRIAGLEGVESTTKALDFYALRIGNGILLRFKYTPNGAPRNVRTERQKRLARQTFTSDEITALTGGAALIKPTLLTVGYTVDGDEISRIEIRRDCKNHLPWSYDIFGGDAVMEPLVLDGLADETKPAVVASARKKAAEHEDAAQG